MEDYHVNGVAVVKYSPDEKSDKTPIIMVHGGNHAAWGWEKWATFFSQAGYEVHALDWLHHGKSDKLPEAEYLKRSITEVAKREIKEVADQLDRPPIIMGHSMGGLAATTYACNAPVEKLVLIAPVMTSAAQADPIPLPIDPSAPVPVFPYPQAKQMFFTKSSEEDAQKYYTLLEPESPQAVLETIQWSTDLDLSKITVPVLVLATESDQIIPHEPLKRYAQLLHADYHQISGVGHSDILLKDPEWREAADYAKTWLEKS